MQQDLKQEISNFRKQLIIDYDSINTWVCFDPLAT